TIGNVTLNSGGNYANVQVGDLTGTMTATNALKPRITIGQLSKATATTHTLGTRTIASIGVASTATHTFNSTDGTLVPITGTGDGADGVVGASSDNTNWQVNLTGTTAAIGITDGAVTNVADVTSPAEPSIAGNPSFQNIVKWQKYDVSTSQP